MARLAERRTKLLTLIDGRARPLRPELSPNEIKQYRVLIADRETHAGEWQRLKDVPEVSPPAMSRAGIAQCKAANAQAAERQELEARLASFAPPEHDWKALFAERSAYESELARYHIDVQRYADWLAERETKQQRAGELKLAVVPFRDLQHRLADALSYEQQLTVYEQLKAHFDDLSVEVAAKRAAADEWRKAKNAMTVLRGLVKQHLVPSLNRVASHLLTDMTGGELRKAVANLALRPGLGQVLTSNVLSHFIGDEIDASLDKDRAENTSNTLQNLVNRISQIILISHKFMPADYCIELGQL